MWIFDMHIFDWFRHKLRMIGEFRRHNLSYDFFTFRLGLLNRLSKYLDIHSYFLGRLEIYPGGKNDYGYAYVSSYMGILLARKYFEKNGFEGWKVDRVVEDDHGAEASRININGYCLHLSRPHRADCIEVKRSLYSPYAPEVDLMVKPDQAQDKETE